MSRGPQLSAESAAIPLRRSGRLKEKAQKKSIPKIGQSKVQLKPKANRLMLSKTGPPPLSSIDRASRAKKKENSATGTSRTAAPPRAPVPLSSAALIRHDLETRGYVTIDQKTELERAAHAPQSESLPSEAGSEMTTYDKNLPNLLGERRIYDADEHLGKGKELKVKEHSDVLRAATEVMVSDQPSISMSDWEIWEVYHKMVSGASLSEVSTIRRAFETYLEVPTVAPAPHYREGSQKWKVEQMSTLNQYPKPDHMEGLAYSEIPVWIKVNPRILDHGHVIPDMFLPNFMAEFKSEGSMKVAHTQCRLDGAFAARAWYEVYTLLLPDEERLGVPFVGTMEFDPDGWRCYIHWVGLATDGEKLHTVENTSANGTPLSFHMCRVAAGYSRYEDVKSFLNARQKAINFRNYFAQRRSRFSEQIKKLPAQEAPPAYKEMNVKTLKSMCKERAPPLTIGGNKKDLIDRLKRDDERKILAPANQPR
ncbi:MAG: hypothetical protein Q9160_005303 [Pyrenula sp. 1 TL-2023]